MKGYNIRLGIRMHSFEVAELWALSQAMAAPRNRVMRQLKQQRAGIQILMFDDQSAIQVVVEQ